MCGTVHKYTHYFIAPLKTLFYCIWFTSIPRMEAPPQRTVVTVYPL